MKRKIISLQLAPQRTPPGIPLVAFDRGERITETSRSGVTVYHLDSDGRLTEKSAYDLDQAEQGNLPDNYKKFRHFIETSRLGSFLSLFIPQNMETTVRSDYKAVRGWLFFHDVGWNMSNYAQGAAIAIALGLNPVWGGVAMATFNLLREKFCQTTGFVVTAMVHHADRNPRPWMLAGEVIDTSGMMVESFAAYTSSVTAALLPLAFAGAFLRVFGGSMKGTAMVYVDPKMAIGGNLGELQRKNGNQGFVSSLIGSGLGLLAVEMFTSMGGGFLAPPLVVLAGAAIALYGISGMVRSLDYHPINEKALRRIVTLLEKTHQIPAPDRSTLNTLLEVGKGDTIRLGADPHPLFKDITRFRELKQFYQLENYLLEVKGGRPIIVLRERCSVNDRLKAELQAVYVDFFKDSALYKKIKAQKGEEFADLWLVLVSYHKTPKNMEKMLEAMETAGWSTDMVRFIDSGRRIKWGKSSTNLPVPN